MTTCFDQYGWIPNAQYRWDLYQKAIDSVRATVWGERKGCLVVHDDYSSRTFSPPAAGVPTFLTRKPTKRGIQLNNNECIQEACRLADWVLVFDSDCIVRPDWVEQAFGWIERFKDDPTVYGFNLFGSKWHPIVAEGEDFWVKNSDAGTGFLFRAADYIPSWGHDAWEICMHMMGWIQGKRLIVPKKPLMNHLGKYGYDHRQEMGVVAEPYNDDTHSDF